MIHAEFRSFPAEIASIAGETGKSIEGYAAIWGALSSVSFRHPKKGEFFERIAPGAFAESLRSGVDVRCCSDHNVEHILGRRSAGTLEVVEDSTGLRFRCTPPDTSYARDIFVSIERRDIQGCSFGMRNVRDQWSRENGKLIRTIVSADLVDVSPTADPAYTGTDVVLRSLDSLEDFERQEREQDASDFVEAIRLRLDVRGKI
jgi:HK97 family phage prohead protease